MPVSPKNVFVAGLVSSDEDGGGAGGGAVDGVCAATLVERASAHAVARPIERSEFVIKAVPPAVRAARP